MKNIYLKLLEIESEGQGFILATVTGTVGSTPQKPGSSAIFQDNRLIAGTVGGGIVEGKVQEAAGKCLLSGKSGLLHLLLNSEISEKEGAICGGEVDILIDANPQMHFSVFRDMKKSLANREPGVLLTMVTQYAEDHVLVNRYWTTGKVRPAIPPEFLERIEPEVKRILASADKDNFSRMELSIPGEEPSSVFFLEPLFPMPKLIIAGAGHIGKALSHLGKIIGFEVTVIDDRGDFANAVNLPDADHIIVKDIGTAMSGLIKDSDTYIVIVTRGHTDDANALKPCIGSGAAYVGMIGSNSKVARMKAEFLEKKWSTGEQWNRIHTPIGLDIKSKTVEEIAISIAAELIQVKNRNR
ncbi:MAG: XdhC/CoxI family protein [Bacteroidales bacterium]|jgi:xanthine dehydrogenase accessory factor|nr:XdhC/CoxI family protein [Bacteroidales bacterium]